jgi:5'/3'-nucleotidase SurE
MAGALADDLNRPLHILLTNDDGYRAAGIEAVHAALLDAGFRVTVAAPRDQQSGSSMRVSIGTITVEQIDERSWAVGGTPADAVAWSLNTVLRDDPPDLAISGANFGQNIGGNTNLSGTVGAAIMATQLGVPALAVSVGIDLAERDAQPDRFPSTAAAFPHAARFVVGLVRNLVRTTPHGSPLLPPHHLLNVNYPALPATAIKGVRSARVGHTGGFTAAYVPGEPAGTVRIELQHGATIDPAVPGGDAELFAAGFITISVIDGSLDAGEAETKAFDQRFDGQLEALLR